MTGPTGLHEGAALIESLQRQVADLQARHAATEHDACLWAEKYGLQVQIIVDLRVRAETAETAESSLRDELAASKKLANISKALLEDCERECSSLGDALAELVACCEYRPVDARGKTMAPMLDQQGGRERAALSKAKAALAALTPPKEGPATLSDLTVSKSPRNSQDAQGRRGRDSEAPSS